MIYLDNAATTQLDEECMDVIRQYNLECFYNPSALYRKAMENGSRFQAIRPLDEIRFHKRILCLAHISDSMLY